MFWKVKFLLIRNLRHKKLNHYFLFQNIIISLNRSSLTLESKVENIVKHYYRIKILNPLFG